MLLADGQPPPTQQQLETMAARFAPVEIGARLTTATSLEESTP